MCCVSYQYGHPLGHPALDPACATVVAHHASRGSDFCRVTLAVFDRHTDERQALRSPRYIVSLKVLRKVAIPES